MKRWTRRGLIGLAAVVLLTAGGFVGWVVVAGRTGRAELRRQQAELDATDPGWRLEDVLAAHEAAFPPPGKNPIEATEKFPTLLPQAYKDWQRNFPDWLPDKQPNRLPRPADVEAATAARAASAAAIAEARRLRDLPAGGGIKLNVTPDVIGTLIPHTQNVREAASLLSLDAILAAVERNPDHAVRSAHAALHAGRAFGDEPFLISMLVRIACAAVARSTLERVLGLSEPDAGLAELQAALAAEAEVPLLTIGFRGERAAMNRLFENIGNGTVPLAALFAAAGLAGGTPGPVDRFAALRYKGELPGDHAKMLETLTKYVEISRKPVHEQLPLYKQVPLPPNEIRYLLTRLLLPACEKVAEAGVRHTATLRAAAVGVAVERFRRAHGRWPESLAEIPKSILPAVPPDAYDGKPLRYVRTRDGALVYSVGPDRTDDGGNVTRAYRLDPGEDYGFQLWDVKHRRADPLPDPDAPPPDPDAP